MHRWEEGTVLSHVPPVSWLHVIEQVLPALVLARCTPISLAHHLVLPPWATLPCDFFLQTSAGGFTSVLFTGLRGGGSVLLPQWGGKSLQIPSGDVGGTDWEVREAMPTSTPEPSGELRPVGSKSCWDNGGTFCISPPPVDEKMEAEGGILPPPLPASLPG